MAQADTDELGEKYSIAVTWGGETHCLRPSLLPPPFPVSHKVLIKFGDDIDLSDDANRFILRKEGLVLDFSNETRLTRRQKQNK